MFYFGREHDGAEMVLEPSKRDTIEVPKMPPGFTVRIRNAGTARSASRHRNMLRSSARFVAAGVARAVASGSPMTSCGKA